MTRRLRLLEVGRLPRFRTKWNPQQVPVVTCGLELGNRLNVVPSGEF